LKGEGIRPDFSLPWVFQYSRHKQQNEAKAYLHEKAPYSHPASFPTVTRQKKKKKKCKTEVLASSLLELESTWCFWECESFSFLE